MYEKISLIRIRESDGWGMSHKKAKQIINYAKNKIAQHKSGNPEYELTEDQIEKLKADIDMATDHLCEEDETCYAIEYILRDYK